MTSQGMNCREDCQLTGNPSWRVAWQGSTYDTSVPLRLDARVLRAEGVDDPTEAEVDASRKEGRTDGETADLDEEAGL
jgi:hypothetical protein